MFLNNDYARPLFDFEKGGPPSAFQCLCMKEHGYHCDHPDCTPCGKITRTERGMRMHLKTVHHWEEQPCLSSTDKPIEESSGEPRSLRLFSEQNIQATTSRSLIPATEPEAVPPAVPQQLTKPEANEGELLKLTSEEK